IIRGIEEVANKSGYRVIISQSNDSTEKEQSNIKALLESQVDGILASYAKETTSFTHYKEVIDRGVPLIFFDRLNEVLESFQTGAVVIDDYLGAYKATTHLIKQGCRRIAHFSGPQHINIYKERKRGYIEALRRNDIAIEESLIIESALNLKAGKELGQQILSWNKLPDAVFSASDFGAVGAMEIFKENGIKVPQDI